MSVLPCQYDACAKWKQKKNAAAIFKMDMISSVFFANIANKLKRKIKCQLNEWMNECVKQESLLVQEHFN